MSPSPSSRRLALGMVAWHALPAILPRAGQSIGGLETGVWTLARGIQAYADLDAHIAVRALGRGSPRSVDGVRLWVTHEPLAPIRRRVSDCVEVGPPLKVKRWDPSLLWQLPLLAAARPWKQPPPAPMAPDPRLLRYRPDAWAGFGVNGDSARVAATAIAQGVPMILFLESNADLDVRLEGEKSFRNAYGESADEQRYALRKATAIVCQTEWQLDRLAQRFGRAGHLLRNPIEIDHWRPQSAPAGKERKQRQGVLWIGRYDDFHKRPRLALEIARRCPDLQFRMITNQHDPTVEQEIRRTSPANVELIDYVPFDRIADFFNSSRVFLSTGNPDYEGFPNVLLQAAASRTPIVSLADFDSFLARSQAGRSAEGSLLQASELLQATAADDRTDWQHVEAYLKTFHSLPKISTGVADLVRQLCVHSSRQ